MTRNTSATCSAHKFEVGHCVQFIDDLFLYSLTHKLHDHYIAAGSQAVVIDASGRFSCLLRIFCGSHERWVDVERFRHTLTQQLVLESLGNDNTD